MQYKDAVKSAEEAVESVKDQRLKEIAFAQVLERLLGTGPVRHDGGQKHAPTGPQRSAPKRAAGSKKPGIIDWMRELVAEGFFKTPRSMNAMLMELGERGHHLTAPDLSWPLRNLCETRALRRKKMVSEGGKAEVWHWANW